MSEAEHLAGGLADPVFDAQSAFRAVMAAMAEPGTVHAPGRLAGPPAPLSAVAATILTTLCDADTPVWLDPALAASEAVTAWIAFHAGSPVTANPVEAHFAFVTDPAAMPAFDGFGLGSHEYPDRSTTIVLQVAGFDGGEPLTLAGPGIETTRTFAPSPMPRNFTTQWAANQARFPRGVDLVLAGPDAVACLPRYTRLVPTED
ncbi:phosphonate C-P lyase system protein PhnH [Zhengella mangrovi]|uniref:Phosphonate C-P lyase system protein PhnH n=1 Tax=Zhengella mangrovi TaxID=1982044 RepID=A0A2G1QTB0_9HYPH|nr:phosphonate C-P lyase system protein PhnH [Zhengella mangrovi]PHP68763.1 phosphonate C-P lyase system protein PhnH [Zhengella mangrovi]